MPTMRQQQREIGRQLAGQGYFISDVGDVGYVLRKGGTDVAAAPRQIREQFERWCRLDRQRAAVAGRPATAAEMDLIDARLQADGYARLDAQSRTVLARGGARAEALLDDLQARLQVFTDDISAALAGEDPGLAFDGFPPFTMHALAVMRLYVAVERGEHPGWGGDRVANGDALLREFARTRPEAPVVLAAVEHNVEGYSNETGLSPDRIRYAVNRIREALPVKTNATMLEAEEKGDVPSLRS